MDRDTIRQLIEGQLPGCEALVEGDDGVHFSARVVASQFAGKSTLERHRMIYGALGERMGTDIHALSIKAMTPEEVNG
ncbi:MAG: BolA/IbaG family iron-sulfur metabolism protein [Gammaproteobacteria bacterium]|nr:MAG: BolA/IbaG family iron-sulfur metabolism protein [Gammaproteobacteria bacterium]